MKIFLGVLAALVLLFAGGRFYVSESADQDIGAVFLLLVGIQFLVAAALLGVSQQDHTPKSPALTDRGDIPGLCPACGFQNVPTATRCDCGYTLSPVKP